MLPVSSDTNILVSVEPVANPFKCKLLPVIDVDAIILLPVIKELSPPAIIFPITVNSPAGVHSNFP